MKLKNQLNYIQKYKETINKIADTYNIQLGFR